MEQVTGAGIASIVVLAYVLIMQALTAAILLLGQLIVLQVRALRSLPVVESRPEHRRKVAESLSPEPVPDHRVVIGGGIRKWE